jgi:SAM-dependent methyltransferase
VEWYDRAEAYDILCGWDPRPERDFVLGASERYGVGPARRILEPFCGTGRLLRVMPGFAVGFDRNPHMVRYARARGVRAFRGDAARFAVREASFDVAFCLIDSFRYLLTEDAAAAHLSGVARALVPGGVYVVGLELTGDLDPDRSLDAWSGARAGTRVEGEVECLGDRAKRVETLRVRLAIRRGRDRERVEDFQPMRVYARADIASLLAAEGSFELAAAFRGSYDIDRPVPFDAAAGSVVLVLRTAGRPDYAGSRAAQPRPPEPPRLTGPRGCR